MAITSREIKAEERFIPIGSRLSTETLAGVLRVRLGRCFIPIGSRLSTET